MSKFPAENLSKAVTKKIELQPESSKIASSKIELSTMKHNLAFQVSWSSLILHGSCIPAAPICRYFACKVQVTIPDMMLPATQLSLGGNV